MSYTSFKIIDSISDTDILSSIEMNIVSFFGWGLLNIGDFTSVRLGSSDIRGSDKSILRLIKDPNFADGRVWATARENLVSESGLSLSTQPIQISGVYVNNSFKTPTTTGFTHYVDYIGGRVVFDSPISTSSVVKMEYSFKNAIVFPADDSILNEQIQFNSLDITQSNYNSSSSGDWSKLGQSKLQLPMIGIEVSPRVEYRPLELGNGNDYIDVDVFCHVFSQNKNQCKKYAYILSRQFEKTIRMYDPDVVASNNLFPIDYRGARNVSGLMYPDLVNGISRYKSDLRFSNTIAEGPYKINNLFHSVVKIKTEIIS